MRRIKILDPNNLDDYPDFKGWKQRVTKVELHFLDGTTQEMKLYFPIFTFWGEAQELTQNYLAALVNHWTRYWLKIKSFQITLGSVNDKGEEHYSISYAINEIPVNKVYVQQWPGGTWEDPETINKWQSEERLKNIIKNMDEGKHPLGETEIKSDPVKAAKKWLN